MKNTEFKNAYCLTACFYYNNIKEVKNNQFPYRKYVDIIKIVQNIKTSCL